MSSTAAAVRIGKTWLASSAPTVDDDATVDGAPRSAGDSWVDLSGPTLYFCSDASAGAAVWTSTGGGGGGSSDHATLTHLGWTASGHTGTASRIAAFDGGGAASFLQVGVDVQAYDAGLASLTGVDTAADLLPYTTAANTWASTAISSTGRTLVGGANAAAMRTTLGLVIGTNVQAWDADLDGLAALGDGVPVRASGSWSAYTTSGSGTVFALATGATLATPTLSSYVTFTDTTANAGAAGRLQRNGAELSWHNGTAATNLEQVSRKDVASGYAGLDASALLKTAEFPAFTGDVTTAAGGVATTIGAHKVTRGMQAQGGACSVVGVTGNATADVADISASTNNTIFGRISNALGFSTVATWLGVLLTTAGAMITFDGTNVIQTSLVNPGFGPGIDGAVSYVANTTLTGNVNATSITISSGVRVATAGFMVRGNGTLTFTDATSIISNNGVAAVGAAQGAGAPGATLGGGSAGGAGNSAGGAGAGSSGRTNSWPISFSAVNTGAGGNGGSDAGGTHAGGTAATPGSISTNSKSYGMSVYDFGSAAGSTALFGGTGGGGGGSSGVGNSGGGGGGGGGVNIVWAYVVTGAGIVEANGGDGANASVGAGSAGGGGGGGGGAAVLVTHLVLNSGTAPTVRANGGAKGLKGGGGNDGQVGTAGYAELRYVA